MQGGRKEKLRMILHPELEALQIGLCSLQCLCQLVGAGGFLHAAGNALNTGDDLINIHAFDELCNALQVSVAATQELNILNLIVLDVEINRLGAGALGIVFVHNKNPF